MDECPQCSTSVPYGVAVCPSCGLIQPPSGARPPLTQVGGLGLATAGTLAGFGFLDLLRPLVGDNPAAAVLSLVALPALLASGPLFVAWLFVVRRNAGRWGPQRRKAGWAIAGWIVPPVLLWFPYQIADDAWKASRPADATGPRASRLWVLGWWLCWLAAWFSGYYYNQADVVLPDGSTHNTFSTGFSMGSNVVSGLFSVAAGLLGAYMVLTISRWQGDRIRRIQTGAPANPLSP
jgi:hypothetical protein